MEANSSNEDSSATGEGGQYQHDPRQVNVHQYYPALDKAFARAVSGRLGARQVLEPITEAAQGYSSSSPTTEENRELQQEQRVEGKESGTVGDFNFSEEKSQPIVDGPQGSVGVFPTAVDEATLEAAQQRSGSGVSVGGPPVNPDLSLSHIVRSKASQHYERGMCAAGEGRWVDAVTSLTKAIGLQDDQAVFYQQRAEAYLQLCDFQSAILNYKKACLLVTGDPRPFQRLTFLFHFQGQCLFDQRLYQEALEAFSKAAEMDPNNISYHICSINCLAALQRHGECLALVNKRLEQDHNNPDLYIMRARLHQMFRNTTLCYYDVKDALEMQPDHLEAALMMQGLQERAAQNKLQALQLSIAGKHREALQKISIAIETHPAVAEYHVLRGALHRKLGDFNAAIDDFLLALDKCDHDDTQPVYGSAQKQLLLTYNDFAVECFTKGFYDEAVILLNKAIRGEKNEKGLYINRGDCFFKQGELNFALQDYQQALELDGSDLNVCMRISVIHNEFGVNMYQEKNYGEAERQFSQALDYNPRVGQYYISRSRARFMQEDVSGAREDLLLGLLLDAGNKDVLSILARLFPGKSVADVLHSPAADASRQLLSNMGPPAAASDSLETTVSGPVATLGNEREDDAPWEAPESAESLQVTGKLVGGLTPLKQCLQEKEFNAMLIQEKKKIQQALQGKGYSGGGGRETSVASARLLTVPRFPHPAPPSFSPEDPLRQPAKGKGAKAPR